MATNTSFKTAQKLCDQHSTCTGFSFTADIKYTGSGCLKACAEKEFGGYGVNTHDYWAKPYVANYKRKYYKKWPHCRNLGACFNNKTTMEAAEKLCDKYALCSGFSFETSVYVGAGCLKNCGTREFGGWGYNTHDYWLRPEPDYKPTYTKKYNRKWPHCANIGACFNVYTKLQQAELLCNKQDYCDGFSFQTAMLIGWGCLKDCHRGSEFGGYGANTHDYWIKPVADYEPKYTKKYTKKWPHCRNYGSCFPASTTLEAAEGLCDRYH